MPSLYERVLERSRATTSHLPVGAFWNEVERNLAAISTTGYRCPMPTVGKYGLRINGVVIGDPSNSVPARVSGSAVLRAVENDLGKPPEDVGVAVAESDTATPARPAAASPAPITGLTIVAQINLRVSELKAELASFEAKKTELAMLELMLSAQEVAKEQAK